MNDRKAIWLYFVGAALPAALVLVFWVLPKAAIHRFRRPSDEDDTAPVDEHLNATTA
jgi:hypothetical protein